MAVALATGAEDLQCHGTVETDVASLIDIALSAAIDEGDDLVAGDLWRLTRWRASPSPPNWQFRPRFGLCRLLRLEFLVQGEQAANRLGMKREALHVLVYSGRLVPLLAQQHLVVEKVEDESLVFGQS